MKKFIFILMLGGLFAQSDDLSTNDNLYLLSGESYTGKFISSDSQFIIFKPTGYSAGQTIEKSIISKVVLNDGTIIYNSLNKRDGSVYTEKILTTAGTNLIQFREDFYLGQLLSLLGTIPIIAGVKSGESPLLYFGVGVIVYGNLKTYLSFVKIGKAWEALIKADEKKKKEQDSP